MSVSADQTIRAQFESFPAQSIETAFLDTGAGSLTISGISGLGEIEVSAEYRVGFGVLSDTQRVLDNLRLNMEVQGNTFHLRTEELNGWSLGNSGWIDIAVKMPKEIALEVKDGSGSLRYSQIAGRVSVPE